jgi:hypothetical protein
MSSVPYSSSYCPAFWGVVQGQGGTYSFKELTYFKTTSARMPLCGCYLPLQIVRNTLPQNMIFLISWDAKTRSQTSARASYSPTNSLPPNKVSKIIWRAKTRSQTSARASYRPTTSLPLTHHRYDIREEPSFTAAVTAEAYVLVYPDGTLKPQAPSDVSRNVSCCCFHVCVCMCVCCVLCARVNAWVCACVRACGLL